MAAIVDGCTRILLVADRALFRDGLRAILDSEADFVVVGEAGTNDEAVMLASRTTPDVVVLDAAMPGWPAATAVAQLRQSAPGTRVLVLSEYEDPGVVQELLAGGIRGYLRKGVCRGDLVSAVRGVHRDDERIVLSISRVSLAHVNSQASSVLSRREREILVMVASAMSNAQIASRLYIAEGTVKRHLRNVFAKLGAVSRIDAVNKAMAAGVISGGHWDGGPRRQPEGSAREPDAKPVLVGAVATVDFSGRPPEVRATRPAALLIACLAGAQPVAQGMFALRYVAGVLLAGPAARAAELRSGMRCSVTGLVVWLLATCAVYLFSGSSESQPDGSRPPATGGSASRGHALGVAGAAGVMALAGSTALGWRMELLVGLTLTLGYFYSAQPFVLKRYPAGVVGFAILCGSATYLAGCFSVDGHLDAREVVFPVAMSLWGLVGYGIRDLPRAGQCASAGDVPAVREAGRGHTVVAGVALAVAGGYLAMEFTQSILAAIPAIVVAAGTAVLVRSLLARKPRADCHRRLPYRIFLVTQYAAHLALLLTV
jgi:DNA-binding NarL/FixJ family response regulator